ncbi:methyltransferase, FxLD system [Streptomyces sp. NBC_01803]|uniref:methyltransferase, FxLD system n=1 Tax=Streptomyces sp. NBC_01803 TaxID=2975946 RepID=UPI002DD94CD2|nr:methyltransferase, FxLD system [Streptomyces sp. NBC_01803]WSA43696.1 methyltransferase, FxLD system [Streptomyces sp. NBC_01803]
MGKTIVDEERAAFLRERVLEALIASGDIVSERVGSVMRRVPRHLFVPDVALDDAYATFKAVVTKRNGQGVAVSSVSAPQIQAMMLEQAGIEPGMRVLEVGSGGLNAAYLAELVGDSGEVTTVDIDPEVTARAERLLAETGFGQRVRVVLADAGEGVPEYAPYDRILITAGAGDIPPAWVAQLTGSGRLVVPLRVKGLTRSIGFQRVGGHLVSTSARVCGFVPMQGAETHQEPPQVVNSTGAITLEFDDGTPPGPGVLDEALRTPRTEVWTGVAVGRQELIDTLRLYLTTVLDGFCFMSVEPGRDTGLVAPRNKRSSVAAMEGKDFVYVTTRLTPDETEVEYGVHAFGPGGPALAETVADHVRTWAENHRGGPGPHIAVYPAGTPDDRLSGQRVIDKKHCRVTLSWSPAASAIGDQGILHHPTEEGKE